MPDLAPRGSPWLQRFGGLHRLRWDALRFRAQRADYYDYLADVVEGTQGRKSLRDIFEDDARRYGPDTVRGRLCLHWAGAYLDAGGDLGVAWSETLPHNECRLLSCVQEEGGDGVAALRDGWRLIQASQLLPPQPGAEYGTSFLKHEFFFEKLV